MTDRLDLWDYRRRMHEIYRRVRETPEPRAAWEGWAADRDRLFREHPQSPVPAESRAAFPGLPLHPYDPAWRFQAGVEPRDGTGSPVAHSGPGTTMFSPIGTVHVDTPFGTASLTLFWLDAYGGGIFLPFRDRTNGDTTYGGGRYLLDTAKGADLGHSGDRVVLDFNFAYHPSCVHDSRWSCPLAPVENHLAIPVPVGERLP